ncbi:gliding motility-associated C-terminal domain-containing protein [Lutimonas sp.]|uniref:T9SS type B sorting domain-containing protein n=1 Tax=Lutimonas sp. TaxID=1872403 RepID=UPI003D9B6213
MNIDYFTFNYGNSKSISLRHRILAFLMFFSFAYTYAQQDITIITTSDDVNWSINFTNSGGAALTWLASGPGLPADIPGTGNNPNFDFSDNTLNQDITITITSTDDFDFVTVLLAPGREISFVDLANMENVQILEMPSNDLLAIDVSTNVALTRLNLNNNSLAAIDISNNVNLEEFDASFNDLTTADVAGIPNLEFLDVSSNQLTTIDLSGNNMLALINLEFNLLNTASIGQVITDVEAYGTGGFGHILNLTGNPGDIPASSIDALDQLILRGWIVRPPVIYDFGDAPDSYATTNANGGAQHIIGDGDLNLGTVYDDEFDGFPGADADGDDTDKVADEDGVDPLDLLGISTSTDNFSVDVDYTNNTSSPANIYAWIDFDRSGAFDADEFATIAIPNGGSGSVTLTWSNLVANGVDILEGDSYARFRTTTDILTANDPGGIVNNGEVEDYFLVIQLDTDRDGVPDVSDLDADNDGILNTDEPGDSNTNGVDDMLELDADGDSCFDSTEAGVRDEDADGYVGTGILTSANVDADGLVISDDNGAINSPVDAYGPLNDLNGNGVLDSQEVGLAANITTQPTDQELIIGDVTFTVVTDLAAGDESYQWEETIDNGLNWTVIADNPGEYAGATTASLVVTNTDVSRLLHRYRVVVSNIAFACDPETTSVEVTYITPDDFDLDGIFDIVDVDDDNDGILDTVEDNGVVDRDTDTDGFPDRIDLDADGDGCPDVEEAGFENNGADMLGNTLPPVVDADGMVTSATDGYTPPANNNGSADPDFQVAGLAAAITTEPVDQNLIIGISTFTVVSDADTYQWQEDKQDGNGFVDIIDTGDYAGAETANLQVTNSDITKLLYRYQVIVSNSAFVCDPTTISVDVGYITPDDFDLDGVFDIVDVDDDNDGILDTVEDNGVLDRDTDGNGAPDRIDLDADGDFCFDVAEAGFTDVNGNGELGNSPVTVDAFGQVTSGSDGYTTPNDLNGNSIPDFQEVGVAASITAQPVDQVYDIVVESTTFSVTVDAVASDATYLWQERIGGVGAWIDVVDGSGYSGATTANLTVPSPADYGSVFNLYRVIVSNVAYDCDPTTTSEEVGFVIPGDFDLDGVFDVVDVDDDNDGILDTVEDNGIVDRDTDGDGFPDRTDLDSDGDFCFDVLEAGFEENGRGELGNANPAVVDATGLVISATDGYTTPNDLDGNGVPDFQETGSQATITTSPTDQPLAPGTVTFSVAGNIDTFRWQEDRQDGNGFVDLVDGGEYSGVSTANLEITITDASKYSYQYQVYVNNVAFACGLEFNSVQVGFIQDQVDTDLDGVFDDFDVDDDNDGIFDTVEGMTTDSNGNGIPDRMELDADGDLCFDVIEAGFEDNGNGELGNALPPVVDANGQVISATDGYTIPADLDGNGIFDFQEAGSASEITVPPQDITIQIGDDASFEVFGDATFYQWQLYDAVGDVWNNVVDDAVYSGATTSELTLTSPADTFDGNIYRVQLTSPDYVCDPNPILNSDQAVLNINVFDADNDGVPDAIDVDDDNDGILDVTEYDGLPPLLDSGQPVPPEYDTDNDGVANQFDLDSDDDFCFDVTEAGFTENGSGLLGTQNPPVVDATGRVTSATDGYTTPNDLDGNGTPDFREFGVGGSIDSQPQPQDFVLNGSATFSVVGVGGGYQWQVSLDDVNWIDLADGGQYSGTSTANMTVSNIEIDNYFEFYRVILTNVALACDTGEISQNTFFNRLPDSDQDGVLDIIDVDDDNDGIFDTVEGEVTDTNLDGIPDRISLDSDSDGCADVREAGFDDSDGDGILGISPVTVNAVGQVIDQQGGYTTPNDLDANGVFDFQEFGEPSVIENQPEDQEITLGDDAVFEVSGTATFYQWEESRDNGTSWVQLTEGGAYSGVNSDRLRITGVRGRFERNLYRVVLSSPDYACDPNLLLVSDEAQLRFNTELIPSGFSPNGDGENDVFSVPGLIETPDFTMEVFDRWGNSVYKYLNNGSLNPDWWDGRSTGNMTLSKGQLVPAGTYFYLIQYNDGNKSPDKGWVYVNY